MIASIASVLYGSESDFPPTENVGMLVKATKSYFQSEFWHPAEAAPIRDIMCCGEVDTPFYLRLALCLLHTDNFALYVMGNIHKKVPVPRLDRMYLWKPEPVKIEGSVSLVHDVVNRFSVSDYNATQAGWPAEPVWRVYCRAVDANGVGTLRLRGVRQSISCGFRLGKLNDTTALLNIDVPASVFIPRRIALALPDGNLDLESLLHPGGDFPVVTVRAEPPSVDYASCASLIQKSQDAMDVLHTVQLADRFLSTAIPCGKVSIALLGLILTTMGIKHSE